MHWVKVKYKSSLLSRKFILYTEKREFERISQGVFGFKLQENGTNIIITEKVVCDDKKGLNVRLCATEEVICTIFPRLYRKKKEFFEYKTEKYKLPTFWNNEIPQLDFEFSKIALAGLWRWNKKGYFVRFKDPELELLALSLVAYIEDGSESD
jgi:hypothetical protein